MAATKKTAVTVKKTMSVFIGGKTSAKKQYRCNLLKSEAAGQLTTVTCQTFVSSYSAEPRAK